MALKRKLTKDEYEALSEGMKNEYKAAGAGYVIDLDGDDEAIVELKETLKKLRTERDGTKAERDARQAKIDELTTEMEALKDASTSGKSEVELERAKFEREKAALLAAHKAEIDKTGAHLSRAYVDREAEAFANKIAKTPAMAKLLSREFKERFRLKLDETDGPSTEILDAEGNPYSLEKLTAEVYANTDFADMLRPTGGSGGGADHNSGNGGSNGGAMTLTQQHALEAKRLGLN